MAKITIEFDDEIMAGFLAQISEQAASATGKVTASKDEDAGATEDTIHTPADIKTLCAELLELTDKAKVKEVLKEFDVTLVSKAAKLEGDDLQDCGEALAEAIAEEKDGGSGGGDEEVTVEAVKVAVQAFTKKNGKEAAGEILEDFDIKSVRSLGKLSQEDLEELYAEVCE